MKHSWRASHFRWVSGFKFKFVRQHAPAERPDQPHSLQVWLFLHFLALTQTKDCAGTIELIPRPV
jgi:hypothetical protein